MNRTNRNVFTWVLVLLFALAAGCASTPEQKSVGEVIDDAVITTRVKAAIIEDPLTKAMEINVETYKGEVQLSGFVSSQEAIDRAVELTRQVEGVTSVKNDMQLRQP